MCWSKKKETSEKEEIPRPPPPPPPPISDTPEKKAENDGSKKGDEPPAAGSKKATKSGPAPSLKEENTQASEPNEDGGTPKENAEPPKRMPQPMSGRPKPTTDYWKDVDPLKAVEQFLKGTGDAVDDAEFGWSNGKKGEVKTFPCDKTEKDLPFAETKEMKAQDVEYKAGLKKRKLQLEMTQSSRMGKIAAELRTKTQEAC